LQTAEEIKEKVGFEGKQTKKVGINLIKEK
jgi:hypothetical protein